MRVSKSYKSFGLVFAIGACLALAGSVVAQGTWRTKPFSQWTKAEVTEVLTDSPWAKTQEGRVARGGAEAPLDTLVTMRLRSALPIRQAVVRLKQLEAKYDRLDDKGRAAFDGKTKGLLDCPACTDNYVVTLSARSENEPGLDPLYNQMKATSLGELRLYVRLVNDHGGERELIHFVAPRSGGEESTFFFSRLDQNGAPLITPTDKKIIFRLNPGVPNSIYNFEFDVSRLIVNGAVEF